MIASQLSDDSMSVQENIERKLAEGLEDHEGRGYMMACVGNRIIAAPFAVLGSIGVLMQLPNFNRFLETHGVIQAQNHLVLGPRDGQQRGYFLSQCRHGAGADVAAEVDDEHAPG